MTPYVAKQWLYELMSDHEFSIPEDAFGELVISLSAPSAPVGVEDVVMAARNAENTIRNCAAAGQIGDGYVQYADDLRDAVQRLAQQPAAVSLTGVELAQGPDDIPRLLLDGREVATFPAGSWPEVCEAFDFGGYRKEQPAAVDETAELVGLLDEVRSHFTRDDDLPDDLLPRIDAALRWIAGGES